MRPSAEQVKKIPTRQESQYLDTVGRNVEAFRKAQAKGTGQRTIPNLEQTYTKAKMRESIPAGAFLPITAASSRSVSDSIPSSPFLQTPAMKDYQNAVAAEKATKAANVAKTTPASKATSTSKKATVSAKTTVPTTQSSLDTGLPKDTTGGLGQFAFSYLFGDGQQGTKQGLTMADYPSYAAFAEATRGKVLTPEQKKYSDEMQKMIQINPDAIDAEIARANNVINQLRASGADTTQQQAYLNKLNQRKQFLAANPFAAAPATSDQLADRQFRESEQAFNQQLENLRAQRALDTGELARQLEDMKQGNVQKSYARMRQAFQNLANRGMLSSGLNWLAQNQEAMTSQEEMADAMQKYADRIGQLSEKYGTKEEQLAQKRAERSPEYFRKQQADLMKSLGQQAGTSQETKAQQLSRLGSFLQAMSSAGVKQSDLQGILRDALGRIVPSEAGAPVKTAAQLNKEAELALRQQQISASIERSRNQYASKSANDKAKIAISLYKLNDQLENSRVKQAIKPIIEQIGFAKSELFALPRMDEKQKEAYLTQIRPQVDALFDALYANANLIEDEGTLEKVQQALQGNLK